MAFVAIPGLIALVQHSSGGLILSAGGYLPGTLIPASVVAAAPALAVGAVAVTAAAAGAYFYLHGVPMPIAELLASKGITVKAATTAAKAAVTDPLTTAKSLATATPAAASIAVPAAKVVLVLVALAAVGYVAYTTSQAVKEAVDELADKVQASMQGQDEQSQSAGLVADFKSALSKLVTTAQEVASDTASRVKDTARGVADSVGRFAEKVADEASAQVDTLKTAAGKASHKLGEAFQDLRSKPD